MVSTGGTCRDLCGERNRVLVDVVAPKSVVRAKVGGSEGGRRAPARGRCRGEDCQGCGNEVNFRGLGLRRGVESGVSVWQCCFVLWVRSHVERCASHDDLHQTDYSASRSDHSLGA